MDDISAPRADVTECPSCQSELSAGDLSCPHCHQLLHADTLKQLAAEADSFTQAGDLSQALVRWRSALELLPPESRQYAVITDKIDALSMQLQKSGTITSTPPADGKPAPAKSKLGPLGALGAAVVFLLSKAKFLLLGLSKATTFLSMLMAFGVYWQLWGWMFAAGFVLSIYVHEMGHVAALRKFGIAASAPMFIPGFGALVRLKQYPANPGEDAYVGLAGPVWGLGAACITGLLFLWTNNPLFAAVTHTGAFLNLLNLTPLGPLDGGRGFRALSKGERYAATIAVFLAWYLSGAGILILVLVMAGVSTFSLTAKPPEKGSLPVLVKYIILIAALAALHYWSAEVTTPRPATTP